ncbi:ribonuclease VapC [Spirochaetia bacterium]|nr:ribonuclease VapC [Spirochaetia bacterium]
MNGLIDDVFVLDTNTVINHLRTDGGEIHLGDCLISVITEMEAMAKPKLSLEEEQRIRNFLSGVSIIPLTDEIKREAILIRRSGTPRPKLPDAIVAATAVILGAKLVTADGDLSRLSWPSLSVVAPL